MSNELYKDEAQQLASRYQRRQESGVGELYSSKYWSFIHFSRTEREFHMGKVLYGRFGDLSKMKVLEVGAGGGDNLYFFLRLGVKEENLIAIELLPERAEQLRRLFPRAKIVQGDALTLNLSENVDVVFQSTVFTSILNPQVKAALMERMHNWANPGGVILWYDFLYDNPRNRDVKGVSKSEVRGYQGNRKSLAWNKVTLAPPIGRRVGRMYPYLNFSFLRTHLVAAWEAHAIV